MPRVAAQVLDVRRQKTIMLAYSVHEGDLAVVEPLLRAGAEVNGLGTGLAPPIVIAAARGHVAMIKLLIHCRANLEAALFETCSENRGQLHDVRAVHAAICGGQVEALQVLLEAGANPNSLDLRGATPLVALSVRDVPHAQMLGMVDALLHAGADPLLENEQNKGCQAIHSAAQRGNTLLVSKLVSSAPTALNAVSEAGMSPLLAAAGWGHEDTLSFLLSAGASDVEILEKRDSCALFEAVHQGKANAVRILLAEGLPAVGGLTSIPAAMLISIRRDYVGILAMLLDVEGEDMRQAWARTPARMRPSSVSPPKLCLHVAASLCSYRAAHVLLSAGADELAVNARGERASEVVGSALGKDISGQGLKGAAIRRMLKRGPAFRARSWTWPTLAQGSVEITAEVIRLTSGSLRVPPLGVRVRKRKDRSFFHRALARYAVTGDISFLGHSP